MDYDKGDIPASYDAGRGYAPGMLVMWLERIAKCAPTGELRTIVDLGCGTGRYSVPLANRFDALVVGIDPSAKMLAEAHKKTGARVALARASGESLPLRDGCVDMVFMSMVFHHFGDPLLAMRECRRVLRPGGTVCLRAATTDRVGTYPYVPFFRRSRSILEASLLSQQRIEDIFIAAGFHLMRHELVEHEVASSWSVYADKIAAGADSMLAQLTAREFDDGMKLLRERAAVTEDAPVAEVVDLFGFRRD